jgi:HD superfamily phosphohydrolase
MNPTAPPTLRIRTALYDDQRFYKTEVDLLHTPALQRLYDLHQLGFSDRVRQLAVTLDRHRALP